MNAEPFATESDTFTNCFVYEFIFLPRITLYCGGHDNTETSRCDVSGSATGNAGRWWPESRPAIVCLLRQLRPSPLLSQPTLSLGIRDIFTDGFGFLVEKAGRPVAGNFGGLGDGHLLGMNFAPPAAEL